VRFTIERLRTMVLAAGVLLIVALGVFLAIGRVRSPFSRRDIPKRLGIDIQQEANGVTYTQSRGGHTLFKIHASRVVQLKNEHAMLHDVKIELYGADGSRVDRIQGNEFEYDQKAGTATAAGPVEITLMRPGEAPAIAPRVTPQQAAGEKAIGNPLASTAQTASSGEIHVETSGLTFDQKSGIATTAQRVDFSMIQGSGSSMGASYDSQGFMVLDHAVELTTRRGIDTVKMHADHAEFERDANRCTLERAVADYRGGRATAAQAKILFRDNGTAVRLDAAGGFSLATATGGRVAAPVGAMDFDQHNEPTHGHLEGGVSMVSDSGMRIVNGTAPTADLKFSQQGRLRHAHLERGVEMQSRETNQAIENGVSVPTRQDRTWRSPVADVEFRAAGHGQVEPASLRGLGGVVITGQSRRGSAPPVPSRLAADEVSGTFGPGSELTAMSGTGHASMEQTTAAGTRETASGDRLEAHFAVRAKDGGKVSAQGGADQVKLAILDGNVVLIDRPAVRQGAPPEPQMRSTAGHAVYEDQGQWLHLTGSPRVEDGVLELTAEKIDVTQESGDAFAHGDVKATWNRTAQDRPAGASSKPETNKAGINAEFSVGLGGQGPAHVVANEAQLHQATGEATFRGDVRLWQQTNSIAAPLIVLDRRKRTLVARSTDAANPVRTVLVSAGGVAGAKPSSQTARAEGDKKPSTPSVIRVRGGDLWYSDAARKAVMHAGDLGTVVAQTATATLLSSEVDLQLTPAASQAGGQSQVERMTASGHVAIDSEGRRGTGQQLVYTGATGEYVLIGTATAPPKLTDSGRGTVTGEALIFHSGDDSVSIEGGGRETTTETTAPAPHPRSGRIEPKE